jgi:hypothetical protein
MSRGKLEPERAASICVGLLYLRCSNSSDIRLFIQRGGPSALPVTRVLCGGPTCLYADDALSFLLFDWSKSFIGAQK